MDSNDNDKVRQGYMRVRKLIVTPTQRILCNPELILGNRSLRLKKPENMLRVVFRDDDNRKLNRLPTWLLKQIVSNTLSNSIYIGCKFFTFLW